MNDCTNLYDLEFFSQNFNKKTDRRQTKTITVPYVNEWMNE